jgi:lipid-A-disaccharide synthase
VRLLARLPSVILANLVLGENVIPEFLQSDCTPERLAEALLPLLSDSPQRQRQVEAFGRLDAIMAIGSAAPSDNAAAVVLDVAQQRARHDPAALGPRRAFG